MFTIRRPYVVLPEVNTTTLNPWIQPYSYATQRSVKYKKHELKGVLSEPSIITTVSPAISSPQGPALFSEVLTTASPTENKLWANLPEQEYNNTASPTENKLWANLPEQEYNNDTGIYQDEFLFPPERYKIVEENLLYEIRVNKFSIVLTNKLI